MSNNNARYDRAREALVSLVEGSAPLNEAQKRAAEEATSLLREAATALNGGRADEAERLVGDAEAALASVAPTTPSPAQPAPAPSSTPTPTTTAPPAPTAQPAPVNPPAQPAQPAPTPAPATRGNIIAGGIIAASIIAVVAGIASIGLAVGADAIRAAAAGGIIAVVAVIAVRAAAQGGGAGITAAMCTAGLAAGITAGVMKSGDVNIAALTIGSIVGTAIAVATTGGGKKMLEMARFAISNATGGNGTQRPQR